MKIHFGYLLGLSALMIAGCAAFFSVYGIGQLFAGATTAVIVMASALEFGKLVAASYLQRYWNKINLLMRIYVVIGVTVLIAITSGGIYGFLSSAYQETYQKLKVSQNEISFLQQKEKFYADDISRYDTELERISANITMLSTTKANSIQIKDTTSSTGFRNTISTSGLRLAQDRINVEEENRKAMVIKRNVVADSLQKYQLAILHKENNSEVAAELGPLTYISKLTDIEMDRVVNYFILLLIFVFDPMAIALVIATNWVFQQEAEKGLGRKDDELEEKPKINKEPSPSDNSGTIALISDDDKSIVEVNNVATPEPEVRIEPPKLIETPQGTRTVLQSSFSTATPEVKVESTPEVKVESTPEVKAESTKTQITSVKPEGIRREDIKEIRQNQNRNFSRSIPARRGY